MTVKKALATTAQHVLMVLLHTHAIALLDSLVPTAKSVRSNIIIAILNQFNIFNYT